MGHMKKGDVHTCLSPRFLPNGGWIRRFWPGSLCTLATLMQSVIKRHTHTHIHVRTFTQNTQKYVTIKGLKSKDYPTVDKRNFDHNKMSLLLYPFTHYTIHTVCYKTPNHSTEKNNSAAMIQTLKTQQGSSRAWSGNPDKATCLVFCATNAPETPEMSPSNHETVIRHI